MCNQLPKSILVYIADNCKWEASRAFSVTSMTDSHIEGTLGYIAEGYRCKSFDAGIWTQVFEFELQRRQNKRRIDALKDEIGELTAKLVDLEDKTKTLESTKAELLEQRNALEDELSLLIA